MDMALNIMYGYRVKYALHNVPIKQISNNNINFFNSLW